MSTELRTPAAAPSTGAADPAPPTILLAEDDATTSTLFASALRRYGWDPIVVGDGRAAWDVVSRVRPAIVVLDWHMPHLDGIELCRRIRRTEEDRETFVLVVTAREADEDLRHALAEGVDDYLVKPASAAQLAARVRIALRRLELDATRRRAERELADARWLAGVGQTALMLQHEVNNPLAALLGHTEFLGEVELPEAAREHIEAIRAQAERIASVVKRIAQLRRPSSVEYVEGVQMIDLWGNPTPGHPEGTPMRQHTSNVSEPAHGTAPAMTQHSAEDWSELLTGRHGHLLELMASGASLPEVLEALVHFIEAHSADALCSVLLLDEATGTLRHGAAGRLGAYAEQIGNVPVGPDIGSCGAAAFRRECVVTPDIATAPSWASHRELPLAHGLRACWSVPILGRGGRVLGTYATYYRTARTPDPRDEALVAATVNIARIVIERARAEQLQRFLLEASDALAGTLSLPAIVETVAQLVVPTLADFCVVETVDEEGRVGTTATAARDQHKAALARELCRRASSEPAWARASARALATGKPVVVSDLAAPGLAANGEDAGHMALVRELGLHSYMALPLVGRDGTIGVATLALTEPVRHYFDEDISLCVELARRAAIAIDNARLYLDAQEAGRRRDESLALLDTLTAASPVGIAVVDRELRYVLTNPALAAYYKKADLKFCLGHTPREAFPQLAPSIEPLFQHVLATGETLRDVEVPRPDGVPAEEWRERLATYFPVRTAAGETLGVGTLVTDVTEHRRTETEVRMLTEALQHAVEGISRLDPQGRYVSVNQAYAAGVGYTPEEMVGMEWPVTVHPDDRAHMLAAYQYMLEHGKVKVEARGVRRDGSIFHKRLVMISAYDAAGQFVGHYCFMQDITEKKAAEMALATQKQFLRQVIDTIPNLIFAKDRQGRFTLVNQAVADSYGTTVEQMLGKSDADFNPNAEEVEAFLRADLAVLDSLEQQLIPEEPITDKAGATRWLQTVKRPIRNEDGSADQILGISTDITARKRTEEALREARAAAEAASRAKSDFLANMSHEIRTPMNGVLGMLELTLDTELPPEQREYLEIAHSSADALLGVINDILDVSKIEAGKMELDPVPFALGQSLSDVASALALRAHSKGIELSVHVEPDVPDAVIGDLGRLRQVLFNLIGNAIKFTARGEILLAVRVEALPSDSEVVLHFSVTDTGIGIAPEKQAVIFEAFAQADTTTTRQYGGSGLGLLICSRLVELMGGRITVESALGKGSTFRFTARLGRGVEAPPAAVSDVAIANRRVLVVDDNATNRLILKQMLGSASMHPTVVASGREALAALAEAPRTGRAFSVVIVDSHMPEMNGLELIAQIRQLALAAAPAILMLSSASDPDEVARCRALGVDVNMTKPIRRAELLAAIRRSLGAAPGECPADEPVPPAAPAPAAGGARNAPNGPSLRVLVAEDNAVNQRLVIALLERRGHHVITVADGRAAVEAWAPGRFDLVLMDVQMPELDGLSATQAIRALEAQTPDVPPVPIVALTARVMPDDHSRCLSAGMNDYLSKPIRTDALFALIESLVPAVPGRVGPPPSTSTTGPHARPAIDVASLLANASGDRSLARELVTIFRHDAPRQLTELHAAILQRDAVRLCEAAHSLKGAANAVGAHKVAEGARALEAAARQGELTEAPALYDAVAGAMAELETGIEGVLAALLLDQGPSDSRIVIGQA